MSTTPSAHRTRSRSRSNSNPHNRPHSRSRPTTPLRTTSRSSLRESASRVSGPYTTSTPLDLLEPNFAELSDAMADLEANFMSLQLMQESLARFSESFAGFMYGMNMNAFCVDFPEAPIPESFKRERNGAFNSDLGAALGLNRSQGDADGEATFLTTDTSFVDNPPSSKTASKFATPAPSRTSRGIPTRGGASRGIPTRGGRGIPRGPAARGRGRGTTR